MFAGPRKVHLFQDNAGKKFRRGSGTMANTLCKHNATGCITTRDPSKVTCKLCLGMLPRPSNRVRVKQRSRSVHRLFTVAFYRRIKPRLSVVRLVDGKSSARNPVYVGVRFNLIFWAVEVVR